LKPESLATAVTVWRIVAARHAGRAFDGEGARRFGGRWNRPGTSIVYTSSTLSLAALELFVHVDPDLAPPDLVALAAELPAGLAIERVEPAELPAGWRSVPPPPELPDLGSRWAERGAAVALAVPSAVVPHEANLLLSPRHPDFARLTLSPPEPFAFDPRMWK
jgi:RES domain-containing protein